MGHSVTYKRKKRTAIAGGSSRKRAKAMGRVILSVSGEGILRSWVTLRVPTPSAIAILVCFLLLAIAILLSPDVAAQFAFAIIQLAHLISQSKK